MYGPIVKRLRQCLAKCAQPHSLWYFSGPAGWVRRAPSFRLSRDVCDGTSNRKLATVAVNLLRPRRAAAPSAACLLGARLEVDVTLPRRLGPVELGPSHRELSWGYGDWLRCSDSSRSPHAPARSVPPWQGLVGLLAGWAPRPGPSGGARQGGWEAAQSAGSEPFQVRVLPEGWARSLGGRAPES